MASSNRHWPSMFKSKPNNHQRQHELNSPLVSSAACHRTTAYTPGLGCEDRAPEPKPRWNPRPEQIRILESIFNSGMVNPPRDEIRKIRAQLQEYGQVGDANVFYWFQNRKSRSKHKQRHAAAVSKPPPATTTLSHPRPATTKTSATALNSYSSSSSDKSSTGKTISAGNVIDLMNSPTASVNNQHHQTFVPTSSEFLSEPFFFPAQQSPAVLPPPPPPPPLELGQGYGFSGGVAADQDGGNFLLSELMLMSNCPSKMKPQHEQQHHSYAATAVSNPTHHFIPPDHNQILQGLREPARSSSTVFINDVCFEVGVGPFSVREAFGDDAVLIQSSGQPVLTNDWGITIQPLQHGGFYYLLRPFASAPSPDDRTIDLI